MGPLPGNRIFGQLQDADVPVILDGRDVGGGRTGKPGGAAQPFEFGLVFCEQAANEQGHTRLAWLLTCREDPPFAVVEQRKAPRAEVPHGMPADPRWIATQLDYLRDVETIQGSHHQLLGSRPRHAERERAPRRQEPAGTSFGFRWVCDCFSALYTPPEIFGQLPHPVIELHCKVFSSIIFELCLAKLHHTVAVLHS